MRRISFILLICLIVPIILIGWDNPMAIGANHDTQTVIELSKPHLHEGGNTYVIKWSGEFGGYSTNDAFQRTFDMLSKQLGFEPIGQVDYINKLPVLRSSKQLTIGVLEQWIYVGTQDQKSSVLILKLTADSYVGYQSILSLQLQIQESLNHLNTRGKWNTMVQGTLSDTGLGGTPEVFLQRLSKEVKGMGQEFYADDHTLSASLFTKILKGGIQSGSRKVNLQIALHQNSITKEWRLTLGSPLITMEY
jgi:hypothetical protein